MSTPRAGADSIAEDPSRDPADAASRQRVLLGISDPLAVGCDRENGPLKVLSADKFHVIRHLGAALDAVRKREYARLDGRGRTFIKGQTYALPIF